MNLSIIYYFIRHYKIRDLNVRISARYCVNKLYIMSGIWGVLGETRFTNNIAILI